MATFTVGDNHMNRWMAEITYRTDRETDVVTFEEISDSHQIIEHGPNWREIDEIAQRQDLRFDRGS
jgi:hypothetical protein